MAKNISKILTACNLFITANKMTILMHDKDQLESLLNKYRRVDFMFEFDVLSDDENKVWLVKIKKNYFACGCNVGKTFMVYAFFIALLALLFTYIFHWGKVSIMMYVYCLLFIFLMAGLGKVFGKMVAYKNLENDIQELKSILI